MIQSTRGSAWLHAQRPLSRPLRHRATDWLMLVPCSAGPLSCSPSPIASPQDFLSPTHHPLRPDAAELHRRRVLLLLAYRSRNPVWGSVRACCLRVGNVLAVVSGTGASASHALMWAIFAGFAAARAVLARGEARVPGGLRRRPSRCRRTSRRAIRAPSFIGARSAPVLCRCCLARSPSVTGGRVAFLFLATAPRAAWLLILGSDRPFRQFFLPKAPPQDR